MPNSRKNIINNYYHSHTICIIRIVRYSNLTAVFVSLDFKNKAREVNSEIFKGKYLGALISVEDAKGKDSKVLLNYGR